MENKETTSPMFGDLDVVENEYSDRDYEIDISIPEFNWVALSLATKTNS